MNKGALARCRHELDSYARVLPSLDLKRRQLAMMLAAERRLLDEAATRLESVLTHHATRLPMLALDELPFDGIWHAELEHAEERLLGLRMPALVTPSWGLPHQNLTGLPAWSDEVADAVRELVGLQVEKGLRSKRVQVLEAGVRHALQKVNLFERVLIPRARDRIRAIRVFLADGERTAIVQAKQARALLHRRTQPEAQRTEQRP
jgi:V/A-type H+-transporting ATPase subunit D